MRPDRAHPERGRFVRDQVAALRRLQDVEVELYEFPPGPTALARAAPALRRRFRRAGLDVVHAHFGLTAWPALAVPARVRAVTLHGTDVRHPRTRLLSAAALPFIDLIAAASPALVAELPLASVRAEAEVLPCGVDLERFRPTSRALARERLGLEPAARYLLFPADPARPEKRHDRALALAQATDARLLALGGVAPEQVPLWVAAADAVVVPSDREGFGLAALEALACDVPVLATPVGVHPEALEGVEGTLCAPFELERWAAALAPLLATGDPRVEGRARAERFGTLEMARRVRAAWRRVLDRAGDARVAGG
jgi:glycosyltransferase involved in cell wall biosynthesis